MLGRQEGRKCWRYSSHLSGRSYSPSHFMTHTGCCRAGGEEGGNFPKSEKVEILKCPTSMVYYPEHRLGSLTLPLTDHVVKPQVLLLLQGRIFASQSALLRIFFPSVLSLQSARLCQLLSTQEITLHNWKRDCQNYNERVDVGTFSSHHNRRQSDNQSFVFKVSQI